MDTYEGAISLAFPGDASYHVMNFKIAATMVRIIRLHIIDLALQAGNCINADCSGKSFIDNAEHEHYVLVLGLGDKFRDDPKVLQSSLGISISHNTVQKVDLALLAGVVVTLSQCQPLILSSG